MLQFNYIAWASTGLHGIGAMLSALASEPLAPWCYRVERRRELCFSVLIYCNNFGIDSPCMLHLDYFVRRSESRPFMVSTELIAYFPCIHDSIYSPKRT